MAILLLSASALAAATVWAQAPAAKSGVPAKSDLELTLQKSMSQSGGANAPLTLTLENAIERAQQNSPQFQAAVTAAKLSKEDRIQAGAALLPSLSGTTQYLNTQGNGKTPTGRFVTNDGVHVYRAWAVLHQDLSANTITLAPYHGAEAGEAMAKAEEEIARRGLRVTVTQDYYMLAAAQRKYATAQQAREEAQRILNITQDLEKQGQVAHSDVIKSQIQFNQEDQAFQEANLGMEKARLSLAVLLFPTFNQDFSVVDDLDAPLALPGFRETLQLAERKNPELAAAEANLRKSKAEVSVARADFFPTISADVDYGIEANAFALRSVAASFPQDGSLPNLGYFATVALNLPVWDWGERSSRLHQAEDRRDLAHLNLSFAQRQILSNLRAYYDEASTTRSEVNTLRISAELSAESLRLNTLRYRAGEATILDLVDAENTYIQAQNAYADGLVRYRTAVATLQTVTGSF